MIPKNVPILIACLALSSCCSSGPEWKVYFSPHGGAAAAIVDEIGKATNSVLVQSAYGLTSAPITNALVAARKRGVDVTVILDKGQKTSSATDILSRAGITTLIDTNSGLAHNKIILIDGLVVITGSYNFSGNAEEDNAENLLVIRDKKLVGKYMANRKLHEKHSEKYLGK